ncbi:unnamed protein product [Plutella xylostella]|uniref:(diamondback moth) hypothetical protein n=1 Tax=Plutella xylostella TaxID=51655 RepID=A0A8S4ED11_PLUXY|nr:unnamed protein product [Plutella xylostella]
MLLQAVTKKNKIEALTNGNFELLTEIWSDHETNGNVPEPVDVLENSTNDVLDTEEPSQEPVTVPELDPETLSALGETTEEAPKFGANIHESLSRLWLPILRKGINKETKEKLAKEYLVPEN